MERLMGCRPYYVFRHHLCFPACQIVSRYAYPASLARHSTNLIIGIRPSLVNIFLPSGIGVNQALGSRLTSRQGIEVSLRRYACFGG